MLRLDRAIVEDIDSGLLPMSEARTNLKRQHSSLSSVPVMDYFHDVLTEVYAS